MRVGRATPGVHAPVFDSRLVTRDSRLATLPLFWFIIDPMALESYNSVLFRRKTNLLAEQGRNRALY